METGEEKSKSISLGRVSAEEGPKYALVISEGGDWSKSVGLRL